MTEKRQILQGFIIRILQHAISSCDEIFVQTCLDQNVVHQVIGPFLVELFLKYTYSWFI
jgi:hypothetical protein